MTGPQLSRRSLLAAAAAAPVLANWRSAASASERPPVTQPRATSFDRRVEPAWEERLTITVGPGAADIPGTSHKAVQAAVDYITALGGGTVQLQPGKFVFRGAVHLRSGVRVVGQGDDTVITKIVTVPFDGFPPFCFNALFVYIIRFRTFTPPIGNFIFIGEDLMIKRKTL